MNKALPAPKIEKVKISKLKPWGKNPRRSHAVDAIAKSIEQFGYLAPIIVQKDTYRILAGHGRLLALKKHGIDQVDVLVADIADDLADLYTLADNKLGELSEWDFQTLAELLKQFDVKGLEAEIAGFSAQELAAIEKFEIPSDNQLIDEASLKETKHECPKCGFTW